MAIFIMTGKYSTEAVKKISGKRTVEAHRIIEQYGGSLKGAYATLGETDILAVVELPDLGEAMKVSVALNKALGISFATTPALPMDEFDKLVGGRK